MPPPDPPHPDDDSLLDRLLGTGQERLPTSLPGRMARLAGTLARTGGGLAARRLRSGAGTLDVKLAEELVRSFGTLKGVAMKAGQLLSYTDESLPPEVRRLLATLQTHSPALPFTVMAGVVRDELGARGGELAERMEPRPVAAASIGQVHRATLPGGEAVAVKVQYPGIEEALRAEFRAAGAGVRFARLLVPGADAAGYVDEARERILAECDYRQELRWQERFAELFAEHPVVSVPAAYADYSSRRVLTSAWQEGSRFDDWLKSDPPAQERNRIGTALYEFYVGTLLRHGLFNADPHPGNYLFAADGRLVVLDYGCVRQFSPGQVQALSRLRDAVRGDREIAIREALRAAGATAPPGAAAFHRTRLLLRAFFSPVLEDRVQGISPLSQLGLSEVLADKRALAQLHLPGEFLFLFRIRFGLHAVLARIGAEANWYRLESGWSAESGGERG